MPIMFLFKNSQSSSDSEAKPRSLVNKKKFFLALTALNLLQGSITPVHAASSYFGSQGPITSGQSASLLSLRRQKFAERDEETFKAPNPSSRFKKDFEDAESSSDFGYTRSGTLVHSSFNNDECTNSLPRYTPHEKIELPKSSRLMRMSQLTRSTAIDESSSYSDDSNQ